MIDFRSDNTGCAAPEILDALLATNSGTALGYGADEWTARLQERFSELFETRVRVFPVATGTAANALSLAAIAPSWGLVFCSAAAQDSNCAIAGNTAAYHSCFGRSRLTEGCAGACGARTTVDET